MFLTLGHSDRTQDDLLCVLQHNKVEVVADLRSSPYSRHASQFNREALKAVLKEAGIGYVFLGEILGGRPEEPWFYDDQGFVLYYKMAEDPRFLEGIERLENGESKGLQVALLCSEGDPAVCHRHLLVSRVLAARGHQVVHILRDDSLIAFEAIPAQTTLLEGEDTTWRSTRSVSPRSPQRTSSSD